MAQGQLKTFVPDATEASIRAAGNAAVAAGGAKIILPAADITVTSPLPYGSGVQYVGTPQPFSYVGNVPDSDWSLAGGTILRGDGTFNCFEANTATKGSPDAAFAGNAITNFGLYRIGFSNFASAVKTGGHNNIGLQFSRLEDLWIEGCTDWALDVVNFMVTDFKRIYMRNGPKAFRFAADCPPTTLMPGNSRIDTLFGVTRASGNERIKGLVFESVGDAVLNEIFATRVQFNAFGRTDIVQPATFTNGSANITVADGSALAVGMPVSFSATANGVTAGRLYMVLSVAGNVITIGNGKTFAAIVSSGAMAQTMTTKGMAAMEIVGGVGGGTGKVTNSSFYGVDLEGSGGAMIWEENTTGITVDIAQVVGTSSVQSHLVCRAAPAGVVRSPGYPLITDIDGASSSTEISGLTSTIRQRSGRGLRNDNTRGINGLQLTVGTNATEAMDIEGRSTTGGTFLYPGNGPMGQKVQAGNSSLSLNAFYGGVVVYAGAGGHTYTLPTITDVSPTSMVGMPFRIVNAGTGLLTVATDGTQLFNSRSGKATYVLMPGQEINMIAAKNASGTLFWAGSLSEPYPVAVAGLPTASAAGQGARAFVTDANATTFASIVAAGGSNKIPVWSDGANWLVG